HLDNRHPLHFKHGINSDEYRVLLWHKRFGSDDWSRLDLKTLNCNFSNCLLTEDKSQLDSVDAVFFHWWDINPSDLPHNHIPGQKWILYNWEPPVYTRKLKGRAIADQIDWVMSYRTDSDIYVPYGSVIPCDNKWQNEDLFDGKNRSVAWIVSNCHSDGNREEYVRELVKYIDIDIYGGCGQYQCPRDDSCLQMIEKKYKFYLSFENSVNWLSISISISTEVVVNTSAREMILLCKDYVTEKLFHIAQYNIIPVVYGSANYSQIMPKNSYINTADFGSPQELANHLKEISSDKQKYNSYMNWKNTYCSQMTYYKYFCSLCKDYVTEKLFRIAEYDVIPVVYGSANYSQIMPKNSYINTADFGSPQELANHLKEISSDKQMYNSYMNWKNTYCSKQTHYKYFCSVCQELNVNSNVNSTKHWNKDDLINWFYRDANCLHPTNDSFTSVP
ncbi:unnamed protein product, partial [Oppiella nova]